jgi:hypothetical protein
MVGDHEHPAATISHIAGSTCFAERVWARLPEQANSTARHAARAKILGEDYMVTTLSRRRADEAHSRETSNRHPHG